MLNIVLATLAIAYACWVCYLSVENILRAKAAGLLTMPAYALGLPLLIVGMVTDFVLNITVATVILVELPREFTVTARLRRHFAAGSGYRYRVACYMGRHFLNPFDKNGNHLVP